MEVLLNPIGQNRTILQRAAASPANVQNLKYEHDSFSGSNNAANKKDVSFGAFNLHIQNLVSELERLKKIRTKCKLEILGSKDLQMQRIFKMARKVATKKIETTTSELIQALMGCTFRENVPPEQITRLLDRRNALQNAVKTSSGRTTELKAAKKKLKNNGDRLMKEIMLAILEQK